ncbi:MAG: transglycosylase family protein [Solirubrobacterales bacterium]
MLTKHTYSVLVLLAVIAFPVAAIAAPGRDQNSQVGVASAVPVSPATHGAVLGWSAQSFRRAIRIGLQRMRAARRAALRRQRREAFANLPGGVSRATLDSIAACESGGDPTAVSADGSYRGKYQFDYGTWESVGGHGDPAAASEAEQDYRAALLYSRSGSSPWPVCG